MLSGERTFEEAPPAAPRGGALERGRAAVAQFEFSLPDGYLNCALAALAVIPCVALIVDVRWRRRDARSWVAAAHQYSIYNLGILPPECP